ncbi:MAG: hypothetical protein EXR62_07580 [Chloroflexi bacterium]|nr:hypothetical protein [Chloroflexota bacterium]
MIAIDFISDFSVNPIPEPDTSLALLLAQTEKHHTTLTLTTSRRGMANQNLNSEGLAETLAVTAHHPRLLPVGTLDPRHYLGWRQELAACVAGGCVAMRFSPGTQGWSPQTLVFNQMVEAIGRVGLPIIVDFNGAGDALEWIYQVAAITQRHSVPVVMNEVSYGYAGELMAVMHEFPQVYAAIRWLCLADGLETMTAEGLGDRLIYGSNTPHYSIRALRNQVLMAKIPDETKQAILAGNALRLLKMDVDHLPVPPLQIQTTVELPQKPIVDIHAHVTGIFLAQPDDTFERSTVPEMCTRCNIDVAIVSAIHAISYDIRVGNAQTQKFLDRYPMLRGYVVGDSRDIPGSVEQMSHYFKDPRFVGVKLYCPVAGHMATQRMQDLLDEVAKFGRPTKIHMDNTGSPYAGVRQAALRNPHLVIIKAHGDDAEGARQVVDLPNVYFEFASSGITPGRVRRSLDILGPERVLFGSDQPLFAPWFELGAYQDAIQTEREADLIYRQNPRRLFDLRV